MPLLGLCIASRSTVIESTKLWHGLIVHLDYADSTCIQVRLFGGLRKLWIFLDMQSSQIENLPKRDTVIQLGKGNA